MGKAAQRLGTLDIREVPVPAADAVLQHLGIGPVAEHLQIVIRLDDDRVGLLRERKRLRHHAADIGHDHELIIIQHQRVAVGEGCVVRHREILRPDAAGHELVPARRQRRTARSVVLACDEMMRQRLRQLGRRPDGLADVLAVGSQRADVIVVVMRDEQPGEIVEAQPLAGQLLLEPPRTEARVDQHAGLAGADFVEYAQEIAVAAAAGGEGLELN